MTRVSFASNPLLLRVTAALFAAAALGTAGYYGVTAESDPANASPVAERQVYAPPTTQYPNRR